MSRRRTLLLFLVVTLVFGTAFPAVKAGLAYVPPLLFAASRSYLAAAILLPYAALTMPYWHPRERADWAAVLAGGVFLIGGSGIGFVAQQFITAGVAAIIFSLSPVVTALLAWAILPAESLGRRDAVGLALGFVGIAIVIRPDPTSLLDPELVGKLLFFAGVTVVALGTVLVRRSETTMPVPAVTGWSMAVGGTVHVAFAAAVGETLAAVDATPAAGVILLYLALVVGAIGVVTYLDLLGAIGAVKASSTTYLIPLVALLLGWLVLGEQVHPLALVGFGVIAVGFGVMESRAIAAELHAYRSLSR